MSQTTAHTRNQLTHERLAGLLRALHPDPEQAAAEYEEIRHAMATYFAFRGSTSAQEDADEVMDRVARLLAEGREIFAANPRSFFYAVARNVWRERLAVPHRNVELEENVLPRDQRPLTPQELMERDYDGRQQERRLACLQECLGKLVPVERELIETYYEGSGRETIDNRLALTRRLGIPLNALRSRVFRIREKLETCISKCLCRKG